MKNKINPRQELPTQIEELADKICIKLNEIDAMEEKLDTANKSKQEWLKELAELLDTSGFTVGSIVVLKNGRKMKLKDFFSANLPSKSSIEGCKDPEKQEEMMIRKENGLKWLDENGLGDVIKNQIIAILPRGDQELAKEVALILEQKNVAYVREESVHSQTLNATLKEAMGNGKNIPHEIFGVITGTTVEIK